MFTVIKQQLFLRVYFQFREIEIVSVSNLATLADHFWIK